MFKKIVYTGIAALAILSCTSNTQKTEKPADEVMPQHQHSPAPAAPKKDLSTIVLDHKKDLVCGMPVSAGVEDTVHYKGKIYGFCAKECKDEFVKAPGSFLAAK